MQLTDKLNSDQTLMSEHTISLLKEHFPLFNEIEKDGYDVDFYLVESYGSITIVPSTKRVRIKMNVGLLSDLLYVSGLVTLMEEWYNDRENKRGFTDGKKIRKDFKKP